MHLLKMKIAFDAFLSNVVLQFGLSSHTQNLGKPHKVGQIAYVRHGLTTTFQFILPHLARARHCFRSYDTMCQGPCVHTIDEKHYFWENIEIFSRVIQY